MLQAQGIIQLESTAGLGGTKRGGRVSPASSDAENRQRPLKRQRYDPAANASQDTASQSNISQAPLSQDDIKPIVKPEDVADLDYLEVGISLSHTHFFQRPFTRPIMLPRWRMSRSLQRNCSKLKAKRD